MPITVLRRVSPPFVFPLIVSSRSALSSGSRGAIHSHLLEDLSNSLARSLRPCSSNLHHQGPSILRKVSLHYINSVSVRSVMLSPEATGRRAMGPPTAPRVGRPNVPCRYCGRMTPRTVYDSLDGFCKEKHRNEWLVVILTLLYPSRWGRLNVRPICQLGMHRTVSLSLVNLVNLRVVSLSLP